METVYAPPLLLAFANERGGGRKPFPWRG